MPPKAPSSQVTTAANAQTSSKLTRIAIVSEDKCRPKKCKQECKRSCPVVKMGASYLRCLLTHTGKLCIEVGPTDKVRYSRAPI